MLCSCCLIVACSTTPVLISEVDNLRVDCAARAASMSPLPSPPPPLLPESLEATSAADDAAVDYRESNCQIPPLLALPSRLQSSDTFALGHSDTLVGSEASRYSPLWRSTVQLSGGAGGSYSQYQCLQPTLSEAAATATIGRHKSFRSGNSGTEYSKWDILKHAFRFLLTSLQRMILFCCFEAGVIRLPKGHSPVANYHQSECGWLQSCPSGQPARMHLWSSDQCHNLALVLMRCSSYCLTCCGCSFGAVAAQLIAAVYLF